jgi:hypothetical protein
MGDIGRYIDLLPDQAKDRVIEAQDWTVGQLVGGDGSRCLVGHAEDWGMSGPRMRQRVIPSENEALMIRRLMFGVDAASRIGSRFDRLCRRVGTQRAVRLVKLRAARRFTPAHCSRDADDGLGTPAGALWT